MSRSNCRLWEFRVEREERAPGAKSKNRGRRSYIARRVVTFHAGQKLKARVEVYSGEENEKYA
ncbi:MAG: hypothetical protein Ct9H90mP27_5440 [Gammaproteobacteria bacterium]|nr:MAG: hypothetical protein Ct9H90mP27_5440 [Gammaproteobacteria bacterium]